MSANDVARQVGFDMRGGWGEGDRATNAYFRPLETFEERFAALLQEVRSLGFAAIDLWTAHLNWAWATPDHLAIAREALDRHGLRVTSLAGGFGATTDEFGRACAVAQAVGARILGGSTPLLATDRAAVLRLLREHDRVLAVENHPEKTPQEMLDKIGDAAGGRVGTAVDTGWYATQGYDAVRAIAELGDRVLHVHLKDVLGADTHETCRYGAGSVPIEGCVRALAAIGYRGPISVEHEPATFDPGPDSAASLRLLEGWLDRLHAE